MVFYIGFEKSIRSKIFSHLYYRYYYWHEVSAKYTLAIISCWLLSKSKIKTYIISSQSKRTDIIRNNEHLKMATTLSMWKIDWIIWIIQSLLTSPDRNIERKYIPCIFGIILIVRYDTSAWIDGRRSYHYLDV